MLTSTAETIDFDLLRRPGSFPWGHTTGYTSKTAAVKPGRHTIFQGRSGSGKTTALHLVAYSALAQWYDITVIDTTKGGHEWEWLNQDAAVVTTIPEAISALEDHHAETSRVYDILRQTGAPRTGILDHQTRQEHCIWDRLIVLDSALEHVTLGAVHNEESLKLKELLADLLGFSRAAGVTVVGSLQPYWRELPAQMRDNFVNQVHFTGPAPGRTLGAQGWFARPERLIEELSEARQDRA